MGKAEIKNEFYQTYSELDALCAAKLGIRSDGLAGYASRLGSTRYAPNREDILGRLARYEMASGSIASGDDPKQEISRDDLKWMKKFERSLIKCNDPLSRYLRRSRSGKIKVKIIAAIVGALALAGLGVAAHLLGWLNSLMGLLKI